MANITVTLSDTQVKCLEYVANSIQDWTDNALHDRARVAQEEIIAKLVAHCNTNEIALAVGTDAQVTQAYDLGLIKTAAQRQAEVEASVVAE